MTLTFKVASKVKVNSAKFNKINLTKEYMFLRLRAMESVAAVGMDSELVESQEAKGSASGYNIEVDLRD